MSLRKATPDERATVEDFLEGLERGLAGNVLPGAAVCVVERQGARFVVLTTPEAAAHPLAELAEAGGLAIGTLENGAFNLDLQGAAIVARHTRSQTVRLNEHATRLYLYGRKVLAGSITHYDPRLRPGDACIVTNPRNEAVGIGVVLGSLKGTGEAVRPVHDLGTYLRDQDE